MSTAAASQALDRMESDEAFATRVKEAGGPEASLEILRSEGFDVNRDEMRDALIDRYGDKLTKEQLDALAAGKAEDVAVWLAGGAAIAGTVVISAAAAAV